MIDIIKSNINKIDFNLKQLFENVQITEISNRNEFLFVIEASSKFKYNDDDYNAKIVASVNKKALLSNNISWTYLSNPLDSNSDKIPMQSSIESFSKDVYDVVNKKKMVNEYFTSLLPIMTLINESVSLIKENESKSDILLNILKKNSIKIESVNEEKVVDLLYIGESYKIEDDNNNLKLSVKYNNKLRPSDLFIIENEIKSIDGVNSIIFNDDQIIIDFYS